MRSRPYFASLLLIPFVGGCGGASDAVPADVVVVTMPSTPASGGVGGGTGGGSPVYVGDFPASGDDDATPEAETPTPRHDKISEIDVEDALETIRRGDKQEQVQLQVEILGETVKDAQQLNDDLADIIEKLREKKGLPKVEPYTSPVQVAIDPVVKMQEKQVANRLPDDVQMVRQMETPSPEQEAAPPAQEQEQTQEDR